MSSAMNQHQIIDNSLTNTDVIKLEDVEEFELDHRLIAETNVQEASTECTFSDLNKIKKEENVVEIVLDHRLLIAETYLLEENTEYTFSDLKYSCTPEENNKDVLTESKVKKEVVAYDTHAVVQLSSSKIPNVNKQLFTCLVCRKNYSTKGSLNVHMRIHTGNKLFKCGVCKKSFTERGRLRIHSRTHTGEKLYECDVCKKKYSHSSTLHQHKRIHTGENLYSCDVCQKTFFRLQNYSNHVRIHTGERPYECDVCAKSFTHPSSLYSHMKTHLC